LRTYVDHYNRQRPHRSLGLKVPQPPPRASLAAGGRVCRRDRHGGLIHEYYRATA
jgi:hypothetical protein